MGIHSAVAAVVLATAACSASAAPNLYKCGATFQDKPCDTEVQKKYSSVTGSFSKEQVNVTADAQCADRGAQALPFIQARTNQQALESVHAQIDGKPIGRLEKVREKELATAVFAKKGGPAEIRGAIETECMDNKQSGKARVSPVYSESNSRQAAADARAAAAAARAAAAEARALRRY
jgi:hypothetical protein